MATLRITNTTGSTITIDDVGIIIPASSFDEFIQPSLIRDLSRSEDLRAFVSAGTLTLSDGTNPVTVGDLISYWGGAGFQFPRDAVMDNDRFWVIQQDAGLTTLSQIGYTPPPTVAGTPTVLNTGSAQFILYTSLAVTDSPAGLLSTVFTQTRRDYRPFYKVTMRTGDNISDVRYWFGLFSSSPMGSSDPAINGMGFRYDTGVDGTAFWRTWSNDGAGGGTITTTSVAIVTGKTYLLSMEFSPDGASILFFIDDILVATHTTDLPGATVDLGHVDQIVTLALASKSVGISKVGVSQRLI